MKSKSKSSILPLLLLAAAIVIIITLTAIRYFSTKTVFNTTNVSGNTAGNLYNNGLFCEYNDKIYFSNAYDNGNIYVMNSNGTNIQKLYNDTASYINAAGKYIYYARNNLNEDTIGAIFRGNLFGVYRINSDGTNNLCLSDKPCGVVSLGNNKVFYQYYEAETALTLKSISIDGKNEEIVDKSAVKPACIQDGLMYYNNVKNNFNLCTLNIENNSVSEIYEGSCWLPIYDDGYVYFMDVDNNYSLARVNLSTKEKESLNTGRVDTYNLYGDYIYYQENDSENPRLCRMNKNGSDAQTIIEGNFCNINVTSEYVYFTQFGYETPIYKVSRTGSLDVTRFDEAEEAVDK